MEQEFNQSTILTNGPRRPPRKKQHAVLVRDNSGSMAGTGKAVHASAASDECVKAAGCDENVLLGVVDFADSATVRHDLTAAPQLKESGVRPIEPNGGTNITAGLDAARELLERLGAEEQAKALRPVTVLFSDGQHNVGADPRDAARRLKEKSILVTVAYGDDADETLLRELATSPEHFYRCAKGDDLRTFFMVMGATLTATRAARQNATMALGALQGFQQ